MADLTPEPGSYRDRNGAVFYRGGEVFRGISDAALANWDRLAAARFFEDGVASGCIVRSERARESEMPHSGWAAVLKHERIPFVSYPYEWSFGMLRDAALLDLELMLAALEEDMILKDSSPYNIQWRGTRPVFIDIPSFEVLQPGEPWVGYRQFCELFLYPLMLQAYRGVDFRRWLRGSIDGISAHEMRAVLSPRDLFRRGVLAHVVLQSVLQRRYAGGDRDVRASLRQAGFDKRLIVQNVLGLKRIIGALEPAGVRTEWSDYETSHSYGDADFQAKIAFVRRAAAAERWPLVWDLGCNTGAFSSVVAEHADYVVAMDGDWLAVERLYQTRKRESNQTMVLPLVVDLSDPSPGQGWRGLERKSLPDRGRPALTLCLALIHHIVIGANIPLRDFLEWLAGLGTALVVEFVGRDDEMVRTLLRNRTDQYTDYSAEAFEAHLSELFDVQATAELKGGKRRLYFGRARFRRP